MVADITYRGQTTRINMMGMSPSEVFATLVSTLIARHPFISLNAFATNLKQIVEMIVEVFPDSKGKEVLKISRSVDKKLAYMLKFKRETDYLESDIWNTILSAEGMPNLRGFGFCNRFKDVLRGNAETISLTNKIKER